jgi:AcrR family transcriptional regulator
MEPAERRAHAFARREREILEAARSLCAEASWELITVSAIAERAGIGKGTVYKHYASKEAILARIQIDHERALYWELKEALDGGLSGGGLSPVARYRLLVHLLWSHNQADWEYHRRMMQYAHRPGILEAWGEDLAREYRAVNDAIFGLYRDAVAEGIAAGVFRDDVAERMAALGANAIGGALRAALAVHATPKAKDEAEIDALVDFILRGFGCPEDRLRAAGA